MQHAFCLREPDPDKTLYDGFTTNVLTNSPLNGIHCLAVPKHNKIMWYMSSRNQTQTWNNSVSQWLILSNPEYNDSIMTECNGSRSKLGEQTSMTEFEWERGVMMQIMIYELWCNPCDKIVPITSWLEDNQSVYNLD